MWMGLVGYESVFSDYLVSGTAVRLGATPPDMAELRDSLYLPAFDGATLTEEVYFTVHVLHDIRPGSTPTFHVHWTHNNASPTGDVKWQIDYSLSKGYSAGTFPAPTTVTTTQTAGAQYTHHITDDDDMPLTGDFEPDAAIICRLYRDSTDSADTFADDAFLVQVDMHYEIAAFGTQDRNRPFDHY
jgi:hypothetical protein